MALANYNTNPSLGSTLISVGGRILRRSARRYLSNNRDQIQSNLQSMARSGYTSARRFVRSRQTRNLRYRVTNRARPTQSGSGVTGQYDRTRQYRKKYMPRRKKRSWRRWIRRVNAVGEKDLGSRTYLANDQVLAEESLPQKSLNLTLGLYGSGSTSPWLNDLRTIASLENEADQTAAAGDTVWKTTKYLFQSGVLDITVRNTSAFVSSTDPVEYISGGKMEVDVYEIMVGKEMNDNTGTKENLSDLFNSGLSDSLNIGGTGNGIAIDDRGATPWDATQSLSYWRVKILKKTKFFLENSGTFTYQYRDPRRHVSTKQALSENEGPNRERWTKFFYIVGKLVPGYDIGTGLNQYRQSLTVGVTRKYLYKIEGVTDDRDRYQSNSFTAALPG